MIEATIVLALVALLSSTLLAPIPWVLNGAAVLLVVGFGLGVPTGLWYHVALARALRPRGELPDQWWLRPVRLHDKLQPDERVHVLRWFFAGGVGFGFTALGCIALAASALRLFLDRS